MALSPVCRKSPAQLGFFDKLRGRKKQFFLPLLCPVKRYLLYHLWFAVYRNE